MSPVFLTLLAVSVVLWYMAKLGNRYTTELPLQVSVDGERFEVACVAEGLGTNLLKYRFTKRKRLRVPLTELRYRRLSGDARDSLLVDSASLHGAIATRLNDVRVLSVGEGPQIHDPRKR